MLAFFMALLAVPALAADIQVTIHVDGDYRPFSYSDSGEAKGMYIAVLKAAFSRMQGFDVQLKPVPWRRGRHIMEEGEGFGLFPAFYHGHDWPYLYPYSLPIYTETIIAVCDADALRLLRSRWPEDYKGLRIGNVAGFDGWGGQAFRELVAEGKIHYEEAKGSKENILKMAHGRLDCIMMEETAFDFLLRKLKLSGEYQEKSHKKFQKGAVVGLDPVYIGYSKPARLAGKHPFQFEFMQAFDNVIYQMTKDGEIKRIMEAYQE